MLLEKLIVTCIVKKFSVFCGTWRIPLLVLVLSDMNPVHNLPYIHIILLYVPRFSKSSPSDFPSRTFYAFLFYLMHATCSTYPIFLALVILIIFRMEFKLWSPSLCTYIQPPVTSFFIGPDSLLRTLFLSTISLCCSLNLRDQVLHSYKNNR